MTAQEKFDVAEMTREIGDILVNSAGLDPSLLDSPNRNTLAELGADSLAVMELQVVLKDRYGVRVPENAIELSVQEIATTVGIHLGEVS